VNLSVKNVPDALAQRLRERAHRNRRSLQRELLVTNRHIQATRFSAYSGQYAAVTSIS
jgi:plasmid stability protein